MTGAVAAAVTTVNAEMAAAGSLMLSLAMPAAGSWLASMAERGSDKMANIDIRRSCLYAQGMHSLTGRYLCDLSCFNGRLHGIAVLRRHRDAGWDGSWATE